MIITLYDSGGNPIKIDDSKEISRGGEGRIIQVGKDYVAKLYLPGITPITETRFLYLNNLQSKQFIKPLRLLMDKNKRVQGYMMQMVPPDFFPLYSIYNQNFCDRNKITSDIKVKVLEQMREAVQYAHDANVVIGDLNPFNILMNSNGEFYFIDVDSYETPGQKHSGRLLEEIRDYLLNGEINVNSDYFALAVISFNTLTNVHPFKGIHKKYGSIAERMVHRIPIFETDPQLIVPKCYTPIQDKQLMEQFKKIFRNGERFLIDIKHKVSTPIKPVIKPTIKTINDLVIHEVLNNVPINYIVPSDKLLLIILDDKAMLYDVAIKGYSTFKNSFERHSTDKFFVTNEQVFVLRNNNLYLINQNTGNLTQLTGLFIDENILYTQQYENILVIVTENKLFTIYLNKIINANIKFEIQNVHGYGFNKIGGLIQNVGGNTFLRYNYKDTLNNIMFPKYLKDVYQIKNIGIGQYIEKEQTKYCLFKINGLNVEILPTQIDSYKNTGYKENNFIAIPNDDKLTIVRLMDGQVITEFECNLLDEQSEIFITDAGIVLRNGNDVSLMNKK